VGEGLEEIIALCEAELDDVEGGSQPPATLTAPERDLVTELHRRRQASLPAEAAVRSSVIRSLCLHPELLTGTQLGELRISGGTVTGALDLVGLRLDMALRFHGTRFEALDLKDTRILSVELHGGSADGIGADRIEVSHDLVISGGFTCRGPLRLRSANIGGDLNLMGASFLAPTGRPSIQFDGAHIGRCLFSRRGAPFHANHGVYGRNCRIGGGFIAGHSRFDRELDLTRAEVGGLVSLRDAVVGGTMTDGEDLEKTALHLDGLIASSDLDLRRVEVGGNAVLLRRMRVGGRLAWNLRGLAARGDVPLRVELKQAQVRMLDDPELDAWDRVEVSLEGFDFDAVAIPHKPEWHERRREMPNLISQQEWLWRRLEWLNQQPEGRWSPHPYDQLRRAFLNSGEESAARETAIRRERVRRGRGGLGRFARWANAIYGLVLGYGYKPSRFFVVSALVVLFFFGIYEVGLDACDPDAANATCGSFSVPDAGAPPFQAMMFSLDAFIPIDLNQVTAWVPIGTAASYLVAVETALGWLLAGLLLGAVTGILRRD
jgi:hypothetical protein